MNFADLNKPQALMKAKILCQRIEECVSALFTQLMFTVRLYTGSDEMEMSAYHFENWLAKRYVVIYAWKPKNY